MTVGAKREERRKLGRVQHPANGVIVICDTQEKLYVQVQDTSPLGIGVCAAWDSPDILGKDVIIVTETLIMYADVVRQEKREGEGCKIGLAAKRFTEDVLQYLFDSIAVEGKEQEEEK